MKLKNLWLFVVVIVMLGMAGTDAYSNDVVIEKTFNVKKGQELMVRSDLGFVEVTTWGKDKVDVVIENRAKGLRKKDVDYILDKMEFRVEKTGSGVDVIAEYKGSKWMNNWSHGISLHFIIKVPKKFDLDVLTAGGGIKVADIDGKVHLKTSGGPIWMGYIDGEVFARSSGGGISLDGASANVDIETSGGGITIGETKGKVHAHTSGGGVTVDGASGNTEVSTSGGGITLKNIEGNIQAHTSGGGIHAEFVGDIDSDCELKTSGGGIKVLLKSDIAIDIDATTSGGSVHTDFPVNVQGKLKSNKLYGKINGGGPLLTLRTSGGNIYINEL